MKSLVTKINLAQAADGRSHRPVANLSLNYSLLMGIIFIGFIIATDFSTVNGLCLILQRLYTLSTLGKFRVKFVLHH